MGPGFSSPVDLFPPAPPQSMQQLLVISQFSQSLGI